MAMSNDREKQAEDALALFGTASFVRFLRDVKESGSCLAVKLANEELDAGRSVQDLFFTGEKFGYYLSIEPEAGHRC
jgi:hypothetical protein